LIRGKKVCCGLSSAAIPNPDRDHDNQTMMMSGGWVLISQSGLSHLNESHLIQSDGNSASNPTIGEVEGYQVVGRPIAVGVVERQGRKILC